ARDGHGSNPVRPYAANRAECRGRHRASPPALCRPASPAAASPTPPPLGDRELRPPCCAQSPTIGRSPARWRHTRVSGAGSLVHVASTLSRLASVPPLIARHDEQTDPPAQRSSVHHPEGWPASNRNGRDQIGIGGR